MKHKDQQTTMKLSDKEFLMINGALEVSIAFGHSIINENPECDQVPKTCETIQTQRDLQSRIREAAPHLFKTRRCACCGTVDCDYGDDPIN